MNFSDLRNIAFLKEATRFVGAGVFNTAFTLALYQVLLFFLNSTTAYTVSWVVGFVSVMAFYPKMVFRRTDGGCKSLAIIGLIYICNFGIGVYLIRAVSLFLGSERLAVFITLLITSAFSFIAMRFALTKFAEKKD